MAHSPTEEIPRPPPDFIKTGCHLSVFVTATVNTEAEQADIQALQGDLDSAHTWINVSSWFCSCLFFLASNQLSFAENHRVFVGQRHDLEADPRGSRPQG
jgi:hypothetical protein